MITYARGTLIPTVSLKVNGQDIKTEGMSWDREDGFGDRSLTATITREDALRLNVVQGANVTLWTSAAENQWDGHLTGPPRLRTDGKAEITANGWALKAEKRTDPLCYQTRDFDLDDALDVPYEIGTDSSHTIEANTRPAAFVFIVTRNETYSTGEATWLARWQPGVVMTRYALSVNLRPGTYSQFHLRTHRFTGPTGARTEIATHALTGGGPGAVDQNISNGQDAFLIGMRCLGGPTTPGSTLKVRIQNFRLNARHPNGTGPTGDVWTVRQLLSDVCAILGLDSSANLASNTLNILPWWAGDGESFLDNLAAATDLSDDHFGFYERGRLVAGPWADSPIWYVRNGPGVDLSPNVIHPQVQVTYDNPKGKPKRVLVTNAAALAKYGENTYEVELSDPQADSTLATAVANALLPVVSEESHSGTVQTTEYRDASGAIRPYGPRPGHRVCIEDWAPGESYTARITSTSGVQGEPLTLGVEGAEANPERILIMADKLEDRRKRGRKRHRKRGRKKKKNR